MAECGKGWSKRCAAAKGTKCTCRCGGENHGTKRSGAEDDAPQRATDDDLFYGYEEKRAPRRLLPSSDKIECIMFRREKKPGESWRGDAVVELVYSDRAGAWPLAHRYVRHSPDGFEFGYEGSGPADTALNLLSLFIPVKETTVGETHYQDFKREFIASIDQEKGGSIDAGKIRDWVKKRWAAADSREMATAAS